MTLRKQSAEILLPRLAALRRRLSSQVFVEQLARGILACTAAAVLLAALERWGGVRIPWELAGAALLIGALLWAGISVILRVPNIQRFAQLLDRLGATRDRWTTALAFSGSEDDARALAHRECMAYLAKRDFRHLLPWSVPRAFTWLMVPGMALVFLQWDMRSERLAERERRAEAEAEVAKTVQQLKTLAQQIEQKKQENKNEELERIAQQLKRSAEQLRTAATDRGTAAKAALRELTNLEQLIKEMQQQPNQLSPEEMEALAKALNQQEETKQAAQALQDGKSNEAAKALEQAAQHLAEKKDEAGDRKAEQTLREALQRLAQQRQSEALRQAIQRALQQSGAGGAQQLLRQLAQILQNSPQGAGGQNPSNDKNSKQNLQGILAALQNMKQGQQGQKGQQPGKPNGADQQKGEGQDGQGQVAIQSFAQAGEGQSPPGDAQLPSGRPGSEMDTGTTDSPFGSERSKIADKGGEMSLRGQLGEGESLSQLLPSAGGDDKARRRYKELYEAVLPAAEEAVLQENIPLGSRYFIRRYFESIRPEE